MQSLISDKINIEKKVTRMMSSFNNPGIIIKQNNKPIVTIPNPIATIPRKMDYSKLKIGSPALKNKITNKFKNKFSLKNSILSSAKQRESRVNSLEHSRSICSWLESEIDRAKKCIPTPKHLNLRRHFSPQVQM